MEKRIEEFTKHLINQGKSKVSQKNYKADIKAFVLWKQSTHPELSLFKGFALYKEYLNSRYSESSVLRKISSINSFLKYTFPFELINEKKDRDSKRNLMILSFSSIGLSTLLIAFAISLLIKNNNIDSDKLDLEGQYFLSAKQEEGSRMQNKDNIRLVVTAPQVDKVLNARNIDMTEYESGTSEDYNQFLGGDATIPQGQTETTIYSPDATKSSFIEITAYSRNNGLYIKEQGDGYFIVASPDTNNTIRFRWLLKNIENNSFIF